MNRNTHAICLSAHLSFNLAVFVGLYIHKVSTAVHYTWSTVMQLALNHMTVDQEQLL